MTDQEIEKRDQETHDAVIQMRAVLLGVEGKGGLVNEVKEVKMCVNEMILKAERREINVAQLLIQVADMAKEFYGNGHRGIKDKVAYLDRFGKDNRRIIIWVLSGVIGVSSILITLVIYHVLTCS